MTFPCTSCGACCRNVSAFKSHGIESDENGVCLKLVDNKCSIYNTRPEICRVDSRPEYKDESTRAEYIKRSAEACNKIQVHLGIDELFRLR